MGKTHEYEVTIEWTGNLGNGTADYKSYDRHHDITATDKERIKASSDPSFRGDKTKWNPEELFLASIASCHQLWYLHLCSVNGIVIESYTDTPSGRMEETANGSGRFIKITLNPVIALSSNCDSADTKKAIKLHKEAHHMCFLANSVNFPILCAPKIVV